MLHDPLLEPGTADITADVDFLNLKHNLEFNDKLITFGPVEQGKFLTTMEAEVRLEKLLANSNADQQEILRSSLDMLVNPQKMGQRFKFLSFFPTVLKSHLEKFPVIGF